MLCELFQEWIRLYFRIEDFSFNHQSREGFNPIENIENIALKSES